MDSLYSESAYGRGVWVSLLYSVSVGHTTMWNHGETSRTNKYPTEDSFNEICGRHLSLPRFLSLYHIFQACNTDTGCPSTSYDISNALLPCNTIYLVLKLYILSFSLILDPPLHILTLYLPTWPQWNRWNVSYQRFRVFWVPLGIKCWQSPRNEGLTDYLPGTTFQGYAFRRATLLVPHQFCNEGTRSPCHPSLCRGGD